MNNRILRELSKELAVPFFSLFNQSVETGVFPQCWKLAHVCSIYMERVVFKHLYNHFYDNNIITPLQSGFIPGDSTTNQLTFLYDTFCQALDAGKEVRKVFCDISKAFDRVWHADLLHHQAAGVLGNLLRWFNSYLTNRKRCVVLRASDPNGIMFGLVCRKDQYWATFVFIIYKWHCEGYRFEYSSFRRRYVSIVYIIVDDPVAAAELLNLDLDKITKWAKEWLVKFNPNKTESLLISRKINRPFHPPLSLLD